MDHCRSVSNQDRLWRWLTLPLLILTIFIQFPCWASPPDNNGRAESKVVTQQDDCQPTWRAAGEEQQDDVVSSRIGTVLFVHSMPDLIPQYSLSRYFATPPPQGKQQWVEDEEIPPKWPVIRANNEFSGADPAPIPGMEYQKPGENVPYFFPFLLGGDNLEVVDPAEDPYLPIFEDAPVGSLLDLNRPNLIGTEVPHQWDFYNLINTDRPDFTDATYTVGKNIVLIESGYTFTRTRAGDLHLNRNQLPEVLFRMGLTNEFELRFKWNGYVLTDLRDEQTGISNQNFGGSDLNIGFKYELLQQDQWRPMVTVVSGTTVPSGTGGVSARQLQPYFNTVLGWGIRRWLYLKVSTGVDFEKGGDPTRVLPGTPAGGPILVTPVNNESLWHSSASLLYQASPRVGGFLEWYTLYSSNAADDRAAHYVDAGFFLYATPNVQFDMRIGERLSDRVDTMFTGAGLSFRY